MMFTTDHEQFTEAMAAYLSGGLTLSERQTLVEHAGACPSCAAALQAAREADASLCALFAAGHLDKGFEQRIVRGLQHAVVPDWRLTIPLRRHPVLYRAATGVAAAVVLGALGYAANDRLRNGTLPMVGAKGSRVTAGKAPMVIAQDASRSMAGERGLATPAEMARDFGYFDFAVKTDSAVNGRGLPKDSDVRGRTGWNLIPNSTVSGGLIVQNPPLDKEMSPQGPAANDAVPPPVTAPPLKVAPLPNDAYDLSLDFDVPKGGEAKAGDSGAGYSNHNGDGQADLNALSEAGGTSKDGFKPGEAFAKQAGGSATGGSALGVGDGLPKRIDSKQGSKADLEANANVDGRADRPEGGAVAQAGTQTPASAERPRSEPPTQSPRPPTTTQPSQQKIIRNGEVQFEVDSFDSALMQITKIAGEEGGFVATTDSEKLPNGKVKGSVVVRVPPDRLDTLVLKLRGLGDLKSSRLGAQDITKQYTDLESRLRADRAMEARLLEIIKSGQGQIKDLLAAEKQLGEYREKIETLEGEIRYYNNLVSLSTLTVSLYERDIKTPTFASEFEQVKMGVEAEDIEKARAEAIAGIEQAKGRIVASDLKKHDAGQLSATIEAEVSPDASGPLIDRLRQIGRVSRLEVDRRQTTQGGTGAPAAAVKVEKRDTHFLISLYNLANVAPRQSSTLVLAAEDVEKTYRLILEQVKSAKGRVVTSQLNRPKAEQTVGTIAVEVPSEQADVLSSVITAAGTLMRLDVANNPDTQNTTDAKRGFSLRIVSLASVAPRETTSLQVAAREVPASFNKLLAAVRGAGARVLNSQLAEQDKSNVSGQIDFEISREDYLKLDEALRQAGDVVSRNMSRSSDTENTVDSKVRLVVGFMDEARLNARETRTVQLAAKNVRERYAKVLESLRDLGAQMIQSQLDEQDPANVTGHLDFAVRRDNLAAVEKTFADAGDVYARRVERLAEQQGTVDSRLRFTVNMKDPQALPPRRTTSLGVEVRDVNKVLHDLEAAATAAGGRVISPTFSSQPDGRTVAKVLLDVGQEKEFELLERVHSSGKVRAQQTSSNDQAPEGAIARVRLEVTLANEEVIVGSDRGLWATIREGLRTSALGLLWTVQMIVVGLCLIGPWLLILWLGWRWYRGAKRRRADGPMTPPVGPTPAAMA